MKTKPQTGIFNINSVFKTKGTLNSTVRKHKPPNNAHNTRNYIYKIPCECLENSIRISEKIKNYIIQKFAKMLGTMTQVKKNYLSIYFGNYFSKFVILELKYHIFFTS